VTGRIPACATRIAAPAAEAAAAEQRWNRRRVCSRARADLQPPPKPIHRPLPEIVTMPSRPLSQRIPPLPADTLRYASRRWHAEAWERERERELRAIENHP
jgi:hypothetical protein